MELRQLRYFVAVAEELHFGRAAQRLFISSPGLSQAIAALERDVGAPLLDRQPRRISMTQAGEMLLPAARQILEQADRTLARLQDHARDGRATLRVGLFSNGMGPLTDPVHDAFRRAHPGTRLEIRGHSGFDNHLELVARRQVDVFVVRPPYAPVQGVAVVPLFAEPAVAVLRREHRLADAPWLTPETLLEEVWPDLPAAPTVWKGHWALDAFRNGEAHRRSASPALAAGDDLTLVASGEAITVTALSRARRDLYAPLTAVPVLDVTSIVALAVREDQDPLVAAYVATVRRVVAELIELVPEARLLDPAAAPVQIGVVADRQTAQSHGARSVRGAPSGP